MRNNPIVLSILIVCSVFTVSCKKEKTKTELLTEKAWLRTALTVNPGIPAGAITITDLLAQIEPCVKDDLLKFTADQKYSEEEGATKCNPSDPQIVEKGTWSFNSGETVLTKIASDTTTFNLVELNATTLKLTDEKILQGIKYTLSYVLTAQ
jgi:hypothetical protein